MEQQVRFCSSQDGARIAYAVHGRGPAIVKVANWLTHLEHDWQSPIWRHWLADFGRGHTLIRCDCRGCGLSDRSPGEVTVEDQLADLAAVVDAAGLERFALLGISAGGAVAVACAARNPQRVSHLILCGAYAQGQLRRNPSPEEREEAELLNSVVRVGWSNPHPLFRRVFTSRFLPSATARQMEWFDEFQPISTSPDGRAPAEGVGRDRRHAPPRACRRPDPGRARARGRRRIFDQGRLLATRIPGARFLPLPGGIPLPLAEDPGWPTLLDEAHRFLGTSGAPEVAGLDELGSREREVLRLVAQGLTNQAIAERLVVSVRTVERHLSNTYVKRGLSGRTHAPPRRRRSPASTRAESDPRRPLWPLRMGAARHPRRTRWVVTRKIRPASVLRIAGPAAPGRSPRANHDQGAAMPLISVKVINGVFTPEQKTQMIERLTDAMVSVEGENMRGVTWCVIDEVQSGDWAIGGECLTTEAVHALAAGQAV